MFWKRKVEGDPIITCPRCAIPMRKKTRGDVTIDVCPKCGGLWLDDKEIDKLVAIGRPAKVKKGKKLKRK